MARIYSSCCARYATRCDKEKKEGKRRGKKRRKRKGTSKVERKRGEKRLGCGALSRGVAWLAVIGFHVSSLPGSGQKSKELTKEMRPVQQRACWLVRGTAEGEKGG